MRQKIPKLIEVSANVAIIVVAALLIVVVVKKYLLPTKPGNPPTASEIALGTKLSITGVDWAGNGRTLVLALQKDCRFCTESALFYHRLVAQTAGRSGVKTIAVFPANLEESKQYLKGLKVEVAEVRESPFANLGVKGTPTLILVDGEGVVRATWGGKLSSEREAEVLKQLQ